MTERLHSDVEAFKVFLKNHPALVEEVRKKGHSWQTYYEKWFLLGEDDPFWSRYQQTPGQTKENTTKSEETSKSDFLATLLKVTENIDMDKVQQQVEQLSRTIGTVQEAMGQFQKNKQSTAHSKQKRDPLRLFKD